MYEAIDCVRQTKLYIYIDLAGSSKSNMEGVLQEANRRRTIACGSRSKKEIAGWRGEIDGSGEEDGLAWFVENQT